MHIFITIVHVIACLTLIGVILLQSGRGGGLSEMLGGGGQQNQKMFGTQTNVFMSKATSVAAIVFLITSISLGVVTTQRSKSLMEGATIEPFFKDLPEGIEGLEGLGAEEAAVLEGEAEAAAEDVANELMGNAAKAE